MAKCKLCKKTITNETGYCDDCSNKKDLKSNESYLDELLSSMQETTTTASEIYKIKKGDQGNDSPDILLSQKDQSFLDDLNDFEVYDITKDMENPIVISDEELYGDDSTSYTDNNEVVTPTEYNERPDQKAEKEEKDGILGHNNIKENEEEFEVSESKEGIIPDTEEIVDDTNASDVQEQVEGFETEQNIDDEFLEMDESIIHNDIEDEHIKPVLDGWLEEEHIEEDSEKEDKVAPENELLELLDQFSPENSAEDDIQAISDLLGGIVTDFQQEDKYPEDVGEVFSEALEAVSDLNDPDNGVNYIIPEVEPIESKKKAGFFKRIFANVEEDDDKGKAKLEKKKKKRAKDIIGQATVQEGTEEAPDKRVQVAETREEKRKKRKEARQKKREQKKEQRKIEVIEDEIDEGRINRVGASIVLVFFGILVILLLISTNAFSYSLSIKNASNYFSRQRYTQAYNEVYGIELKDEDIELYDKIMTVMFVNKQLNSYNNYYHIKKYPEALDSLLKGLQRYDKYVELATMLGIKTDLDYVREQIIAELYNVFSLTEEEALNIINSESQLKYSIEVYDVVLENISYYNTY